MKTNILITLFAICSLKAIGQTGWIQQNSKFNGSLSDVCFINPDTGWVVGARGRILHTTNGGEQWNRQTSNTRVYLTKIFFISALKGWIVGENSTILHTEDGGENWNFQQLDVNDALLFDVFFVNDSSGWIANSQYNNQSGNNIYKTTNGGENWSRKNIDWSNSPSVNSLFFLNQDVGWIGNHGIGIGITNNGGSTWSLNENEHCVNSIHFINENTGWINCSPMGIYKTTDGGYTWQHNTSQPATWGVDVYFFNENIGWATSGTPDSSFIMKTTNGGNSWTIQNSHPLSTVEFNSLCFIDENLGWVVGTGGVIYKFGSSAYINSLERNVNSNNILSIQIIPHAYTTIFAIKYELAKSGYVKLEVYNLNGSKIETLVNKRQTEGEHYVAWQPQDLPSGIYIVKLQNEELMYTKKLVLKK